MNLVDRDTVLKIIQDEEELEGEMPESLKQRMLLILDSEDSMDQLQYLLRSVVKVTKRSIAEKISNL